MVNISGLIHYHVILRGMASHDRDQSFWEESFSVRERILFFCVGVSSVGTGDILPFAFTVIFSEIKEYIIFTDTYFRLLLLFKIGS